jgi:hypothetical protein
MEQVIVLVLSLVSVVAGMTLCLGGLVPRWTHLPFLHRRQPPAPRHRRVSPSNARPHTREAA